MPDNPTQPDRHASDSHGPSDPAETQPRPRQHRLRVDESQLTTSYANSFRSNVTVDELMLDFGINSPVTSDQPQPADAAALAASSEICFHATHRVIMNHYTAKRLAILLSQIVRQHEQRFGELKLNIADRAVAPR